MNEEKTSVSQYGIFDSAVSTANALSTSVDTCKDILYKAKSELGNNSIFEGPLCDECVNSFGEVDTKIAEITNHCSQIKDFLVKASKDYQSADSNNSKTVQASGKSDNNTKNSGKNNTDANNLSGSVSSYDSANSTMKSVADIAKENAGGGYDGMCEMWAETQWQEATGISRENQVSARDAWLNFGVSSSKENIPVGAMVYSTGSGSPYGHVGIYVGDGMVADQGGVEPLDDWISHHNSPNEYGEAGWLGWGWQNGVDLTEQ